MTREQATHLMDEAEKLGAQPSRMFDGSRGYAVWLQVDGRRVECDTERDAAEALRRLRAVRAKNEKVMT